jgi:hypothetical protein
VPGPDANGDAVKLRLCEFFLQFDIDRYVDDSDDSMAMHRYVIIFCLVAVCSVIACFPIQATIW